MDRRPNDRFKNRFRRPQDGKTGRYTAQKTDAHDAEEDPNSDEEESCEEESDLTAAFEREMDELASVVEELRDTLDVQDVEDLRELSESMYEGRATIKETHAKLREKTRNRGYQPSSFFPPYDKMCNVQREGMTKGSRKAVSMSVKPKKSEKQ